MEHLYYRRVMTPDKDKEKCGGEQKTVYHWEMEERSLNAEQTAYLQVWIISADKQPEIMQWEAEGDGAGGRRQQIHNEKKVGCA